MKIQLASFKILEVPERIQNGFAQYVPHLCFKTLSADSTSCWGSLMSHSLWETFCSSSSTSSGGQGTADGSETWKQHEYNVCVLGARGHRRPDDLLVLSVYKSSVFRKRKREQLQRCALLSMASAALRELVPERFPCFVLCPASVCICCTFPFSSSSMGPAPFPFGMAARLLSHLPHLGRPLIFLLLPPHVVGNQVPYCVIIMWMCVPLLAGPPAASGDLIHNSGDCLLNTRCGLGATLMLYMHLIQSSWCLAEFALYSTKKTKTQKL